MAATDSQRPRWRTSTYSGTAGGQCVEVADLSSAVRVRDSKTPDDVVLSFSPGAWKAFVEATAHGEL